MINSSYFTKKKTRELTFSLSAEYLEPISSLSALVAANKSSNFESSSVSRRFSLAKPDSRDMALESGGEIDFVTISLIWAGTFVDGVSSARGVWYDCSLSLMFERWSSSSL